MTATFGDQKHLFIFIRELNTYPYTICLRSSPEIYSHIKNPARDTLNNFVFFAGLYLIVNTTNRTAFFGQGSIYMNYIVGDSKLTQDLFGVYSCKKTPFIDSRLSI